MYKMQFCKIAGWQTPHGLCGEQMSLIEVLIKYCEINLYWLFFFMNLGILENQNKIDETNRIGSIFRNKYKTTDTWQPQFCIDVWTD